MLKVHSIIEERHIHAAGRRSASLRGVQPMPKAPTPQWVLPGPAAMRVIPPSSKRQSLPWGKVRVAVRSRGVVRWL